MLDILLLVLKIIGWSLAGLVGLLLLLCMIALLVPFRYRGRAAYKDKPDVSAHCTFLLRMLHVPVTYDDGIKCTVKLFGIPVYANYETKWGKRRAARRAKKAEKRKKKEEKRRKKAQKERQKQKEKRRKEIKNSAVNANNNSARSEDAKSKTTADKEILAGMKDSLGGEDASGGNAAGVKDKHGEAVTADKNATAGFAGADTKEDEISNEENKTIAEQLQKLYNYLEDIPDILEEKYESFYAKAEGVAVNLTDRYNKITDIYGKITDERVRAALKKVLKELARLKPRKFEGRVRYGFDDPAVTGYTSGLAAVLYIFYKNYLEIIPDFTEQVIDGEVRIRGRLTLLKVGIIALRIIRNKDCKYTYKLFKGLKEDKSDNT